MSERSLDKKYANGSLKLSDDICTPAAFDCLFPGANISLDTYRYFKRMHGHWGHRSEMQKNGYVNMAYHLIARDIAGLSLSDLEFINITRRGFRGLIKRAFAEDNLVVVDTIHPNGDMHSLGMMEVDDDLYQMKGMPIRSELAKPVRIERVLDFMIFPGRNPSKQFPHVNTNVIIFPAN